MKRSFAVLAMLLPLLCGCSGMREESADLPSETIVPSAAASQSAVDKPAEKLSERRMEEFIFEGGGYEITDGVHTNYYGEITDEAIRQQLWDIICTQEEQDVFEGGSSGSSFSLVLTDRETGEKTYVGYTIWYANPEEEGGPSCFCVSGASGGTICYAEAEDMQTETYLSDTFNALVLEGIRREENIVHRAE